ncbi:MAG TPA: alpha/beta hydrolase [Flavisolibacter sp.]|nr:alpha/beta hydrolase [Flavisolibacter sp.]
MKKILTLLLCVTTVIVSAQTLNYPYPVQFLSLNIEQQSVKMAYMDVPSSKPNGKAVLLLHGKNFNGYYWKDVITFLTDNGYRVIIPDQVGWGRSDKPNIHYSFHLLAANTKKLLDTLGIQKVNVIGHSMGGMLATRFALMFPQTVEKLIYENPIGLEDYKTFVPYHSVDEQYNNELKANFESLKNYQQSYYPEWKPEYDQYVTAQYEALQIPDFKTATWASALTYQMIYEQPVVYEFKNITAPTLIIIGQEDRTVVGKNLLSKELAAQHGNYPQLGKWLQGQIRNSKLAELKAVGHIPHIQSLPAFRDAVLNFLKT